MKKYLLVEPNFPIPTKSKNHKNFLPTGLLKIGAYLKDKGYFVKLVRGQSVFVESEDQFYPDEIWITSLFTYWASHVYDSVDYYRKKYPKARIIVGGIFASLFEKTKVIAYLGCDDVYQGVFEAAENYRPDYTLLLENSIDYQILHTSRGCTRKCSFCGTWKIEKEFTEKESIKNEIFKQKLVFYDNNLLQNSNIESIFDELITLKKQKQIIWCESQSGFDGRILTEKPAYARLIYQAGFRYPRIAWDNTYREHVQIKKQIDLLINAGFKPVDISVFVLFNWDVEFSEMEKKRKKCWEWKVQIADCRFRPLNQLYDYYNGLKEQTLKDYYIHEKAGWSDKLVKQFRKNVRRQNICVRHKFPFYSRTFEINKGSNELLGNLKRIESTEDKIAYLQQNNIDYWVP